MFRIWKPYGVQFVWITAFDPASSDGVLDLAVVVDEGVARGEGAARLAAIRFLGPSRPESVIHACISGARRLLEQASVGARPLTDWPQALQDRLLAQLLGRAIAHEIGHYLLASPQHSRRGLMRAVFTTEDLVGNDRARFELEPAQVRALRLDEARPEPAVMGTPE